MTRHRSARRWSLAFAVLAMISASTAAVAQQLPSGGRTSWEIEELEAQRARLHRAVVKDG